jgi:AhpD family alkylhydroperoxidase
MSKAELDAGTSLNEHEPEQEKSTPWYVLNSPEIGKPFQDFYDACNTTGVLNKKTKELLMVALASAFRCPQCTEAHIQAALDAGVSREEITEALLIAMAEAAGTQLNWAKDIYLKNLNGSHK